MSCFLGAPTYSSPAAIVASAYYIPRPFYFNYLQFHERVYEHLTSYRRDKILLPQNSSSSLNRIPGCAAIFNTRQVKFTVSLDGYLALAQAKTLAATQPFLAATKPAPRVVRCRRMSSLRTSHLSFCSRPLCFPAQKSPIH